MGNMVAILGTGGFGREVLWAVREMKSNYVEGADLNSRFNSIVFLDDDLDLYGERVCGAKVLGSIEGARDEIEDRDVYFVCGVGSNELRERFVNRVEIVFGKGRFLLVEHKSVKKSKYVEIGEGTVICAGCIITTQVSIGKHVNLNLDCTVSHNSVIEDYVNVSPGVHISGHCVLKTGCDIGTGVNIMPGSVIGENSVVGAGACVVKDIPPNSLAVGVPARVIKSLGPQSNE